MEMIFLDDINVIFDCICRSGTKNYKCYNILKDLLLNNSDFRGIIERGIKENKIFGFSDELWKKLNNQNLRFRGINSFDDIFRNGFNLGYCTPCAKQVSYSLGTCEICGGVLPILIGTNNCPNGDHTWIEYDGKIIDTSLMLIIDLEYKSLIGYIEKNRYNPNQDVTYCAAKEFTNDSSFKKK